MIKLMNAIKKIFERNPNPYIAAKLIELERAEVYIKFMQAAIKRGYAVEIVVVVDGQFCSSTTMASAWDGKGKSVLIYLLEAALGERLRLWTELEAFGYAPDKGP